jgi:hypothetical protein
MAQCQYIDDESGIHCSSEATRRVTLAWENPPQPGRQGEAGTIKIVNSCDEHDPDPTTSSPI